MVLDGELLDVPAARAAFEEVLALRPDDTMATRGARGARGRRAELEEVRREVRPGGERLDRSQPRDRALRVGGRGVRPVRARGAPRPRATCARRSRSIRKNRKAAFHLARLLRRAERWHDLARAARRARRASPRRSRRRSPRCSSLAEIARDAPRRDAPRAPTPRSSACSRSIRRTRRRCARSPTQLAASQNWLALVATYQAALKARRDDEDLGMLLQIAMVLWKHVGDLDQAEEYFRRVRKLEPAHPAALDFYRVYYPAKGENQKLLALLRQVEKSPRARSDSGAADRRRDRRARRGAEQPREGDRGLEAAPAPGPDVEAAQARTALARLYRRTEKWNALLDLMKDEIERLPEGDVAGARRAAARGRRDLSRQAAARRDGDQHLQRDPQDRSGQPARDRRARRRSSARSAGGTI